MSSKHTSTGSLDEKDAKSQQCNCVLVQQKKQHLINRYIMAIRDIYGYRTSAT